MYSFDGRRRAIADAAPGGHRAGVPRLHGARDAQAPAAGEALVLSGVLPRRGAAEGPLPAVLADRRRGDRLRRPGRRRRADRAAARDPRGASAPPRAAADRRRSARPRRAPPTARSCRPTCARTRTGCPRRCATASTSTRCARSTPTTRRRRRSWRARRCLLDRLDRRRPRALRRGQRLLDAPASRTRSTRRSCAACDYYTRTVFEFTSDALGAQSGVGGGGRYDGLIEQLGGAADARLRLGRRGRAHADGRAAASRSRRRRSTSTSPPRTRRTARPRSASPSTRAGPATRRSSSWPGARSRASSSRPTGIGARYVAVVGRRRRRPQGHGIGRPADGGGATR